MSALGTADLTLERPAPSATQASVLAKTGTEAVPRPPTPEPMARTSTQSEERACQRVPIGGPSSGTRDLARRWTVTVVKQLATLGVALVAIVMALLTWDYYVAAPWTRGGRVRVQVASVAPQISGQIVELRVGDNQYVHKGDVLYVIDPFDFEVALREGKAQAQQRAADQRVKECNPSGGNACRALRGPRRNSRPSPAARSRRRLFSRRLSNKSRRPRSTCAGPRFAARSTATSPIS